MNLSNSKNTLLFEINNINNFRNSLDEIQKNIKEKNIIIDFIELDFDEFFEDLNNLFKKSKKNNRSFVIINSDFRSEYYNLSIDIVPSLQEAIDIIEIEEIERDLGLL
ncbi:MAG: ribonuclease Z [Flavobacteriaceae bacterium]|nr:ribonuclease Z [Flavobacteriaceae bacterium]MDG1792496.1 ribonuclease Z [Flavobacteriaceae bacterium]MDG2485351.1 ribonuclease Z [Flavobacteriaceae bacterium]